MSMPGNVNPISALIACIFAIPILAGVCMPFTSDRIHRSFSSLLNNLIVLASIILSVYLTRIILSDKSGLILTSLYQLFPALQAAVSGNDIWVYALFIVVLTLVIDGILYLLTTPVYRYAVVPVSNRVSSAVATMSGFARRLLGGLWQLPKSVWLVLVFSILLNFYTDCLGSSLVNEYADGSAPYQLIQENVIQPLLNNSVVKNIKVLFNDSFRKAETDGSGAASRSRLIVYFNGVTLEEAVKSDSAIDAAAKAIVGTETDDGRKAFLLYRWISKNIKYDGAKAEEIVSSHAKVSSGAVVAYRTRTGVCFDYACLYVAMCRAAGLRVRFVSGLGYSGTDWGDHAWNQVYDPGEDRWLNVDTTFGSSGVNYFDRLNFSLDHMDGVIQGEW